MKAGSGPERTCLGCRQRAPKETLLRVVMGPDGPTLDPTGRGRGAYLHPSEACLGEAVLGRSLPKALRTGVPSDGAARLGTEINRLLEAH